MLSTKQIARFGHLALTDDVTVLCPDTEKPKVKKWMVDTKE